MKTRIGNVVIAVVTLFVCLAFVVAAPVQAQEMAQKHSEVKGKMRLVMENATTKRSTAQRLCVKV